MNRITRLVRDCEVLFIQELTGALLLALTLSHACLVERSSLQEALLGNADEYRCLSAREFDLGSKTGPICSCVCDAESAADQTRNIRAKKTDNNVPYAESAADQTRNIRVKKTGTMSVMLILPPIEHVTSALRKWAQRQAEAIPFYQYTFARYRSSNSIFAECVRGYLAVTRACLGRQQRANIDSSDVCPQGTMCSCRDRLARL